MDQISLEQEMVDGGRNRAKKMFENNEASGNASANPYASAVYRRFVLPLAAVIKADMDRKLAGRAQAHVTLMKGMDYEAVAFIAVRGVLCGCLHQAGDVASPGRSALNAVGRSVYSEYLLTQFEAINPELYYTLVHDFERKLTKSERHRMTVFKMQAKANGINFIEWGDGGAAQVGSYLVTTLEALGLCTITQSRKKVGKQVREQFDIRLCDDVMQLLSSIKEHVMEATPEVMPCIEQPKDWTEIAEGGWHTQAMRATNPYCVRTSGRGRELIRTNDMSIEFAALNALQRVKWQVHGKMLDTIRRVAQHFDMDEIVSQAECPAPEKPEWLERGMDKKDMTENQLGEFTAWKHQTAEWHTEMKLRGTRWGRLYTSTRIADKFRDFPVIHFVYFEDFRGRKYAQTTGINPQGSDMQKALLRFAEGKPVTTTEQVEWFMINGANRFGVDKVSISDRLKWVAEHHEMIMGFARDPIENSAWREADSPFQFLAWCFEYADFNAFPGVFRTHLPVGMDGSCNGLQNFSAMLRDGVGGEATNLTPSPIPKDIYATVAEVVMRKLHNAKADEDGFRDMWIKHGVNRSLVKRSVMTLPYGSTRFSCADFIVGDYLKLGKAPEIPKPLYARAANYLSHFVWAAIGDVVIKARQAMDWLQECAKTLVKRGVTEITWKSPSGFPAVQLYWQKDEHRINTRLCGGTKLVVSRESDLVDSNRHRNGIAPNFIHSMDAAHLTLVVVRASQLGIDALAMIHDDYGTHATDAPLLAKIIREVFVDMYTKGNPLTEFAAQYEDLPPPPDTGDLVLSEVLNSRYFFC